MTEQQWICERVTLVNALGLHARAAASLARCASAFKSEVKLKKDDTEVNAKSIMGLLMLAMPVGESFEIKACGEDAQEAMGALVGLVANKFGEA
ncbi:MAG: HPr family phosphocarrier protein [Deferribacteraceae bacterium]|jgi:phosphocarrier protein|nr:HPr family phosphocarrier protein [Deferribacteraceae bacterium]